MILPADAVWLASIGIPALIIAGSAAWPVLRAVPVSASAIRRGEIGAGLLTILVGLDAALAGPGNEHR